MKQYKVLQSECSTGILIWSSLEKELNDLAKEGWSVVSSSSFVMTNDYYMVIVILEK